MSKESSKMGIWILVDALLLLAIVVIVAFVVGQTKLNNQGKDTPTPVPNKPTQIAADTPSPTQKQDQTPTPADNSTPTPDASTLQKLLPTHLHLPVPLSTETQHAT